MAITVNPATFVINVPRDDLDIVQLTPTEIRNMDLNWFKNSLGDIMDDAFGMPLLKMFEHNTEVNLGGLTYARTIEVLEPYTVTFEDGQYAVNLIGANSNVADKTNVNQVSIRPQNSAGLISNADIEYGSFNGGVTYDEINGYSGVGQISSGANIGTPRAPSNNLYDAKTIAVYRGFDTFYIIGDMTIPEYDIDEVTPFELVNYTFLGSGKDSTTVDIPSIAHVETCRYIDAHITGVLDGFNTLTDCLIDNLVYIKGYLDSCVIAPGVITLGGDDTAHFLDCFSGVPGQGTPTIDMGGSGQALAIRNYNGGIALTNKSGDEDVSIDLNSGQVKLDLTTVTDGTIVIRGIGIVWDSNTGDNIPTGQYGDLTVVNEAINKENISDAVWDDVLVDHTIDGSFGNELATKADLASQIQLSQTTATSGGAIYGNVISGDYTTTIVKDDVSWTINEDATNGITVDYTFNLPSENHKPQEISINGYYTGTPDGTHFIDLWAWSYDASAWELLQEGYMPGNKTASEPYTQTYYERNIDRNNNNEIHIRLIHHVTAYNGSHYLYIDYIEASSVETSSVAETADAVWEHTTAGQLIADVSFIKEMEGGRWQIVGTQMIFYANDNVTEVARFNMFDDVGDPNVETVFERVRV